MVLGNGNHSDKEDDESARDTAAILIQRLWRGRHNLANDRHLNSQLRWDDAATRANLEVQRHAALNSSSTPKQRWHRATFFVVQLNNKNDMLSSNGVQVDAEEKHLETQHWLELIDGKHRYGSNLKWYHRKWQEADTDDNFFKWLDRGGGKILSLDECSREQLEKERIIYLSAEQRLNYLVKIGEDGLLYWEKNNQPVDTAAGHWKDAGDGQGIVPENTPTKRLEHTNLKEGVPITTSTASDDSKDQENAAMHYTGQTKGKHWWSRYFQRHFTPRGAMDRLLRKTVRRNTWIYISDKNFNIFIGVKETGTFQHSSFLAGGMVTSAGLISVKQGAIHTLSPLSGHYRTSVNHFHKFLNVLESRGVDMRKVHISKAEAALWGIEHVTKFKKATNHALESGKQKLHEAPHKVEVFLAEHSVSDTKWKNEILSGRNSSHRNPSCPTQTEGTNSQLEEGAGPPLDEDTLSSPQG